ncbi:MAG: hypothetical protein AAGI90_03155 [Chlamydiota bacterium]
MYLFPYLLLAASTLVGFSYKSYEPNQTLDTHMSTQEAEDTGVSRLSPEEKQALQKWINKNHYVRPGAKRQDEAPPEVSEVIGNGAYVKLSDGSIWQIHPTDRLLTQSWISAAEITVEKSGASTYSYRLKNNLTGSVVRAERVPKIPDYFHPPTSSPSGKKTPKKKEASPAHDVKESPSKKQDDGYPKIFRE